MLSQGWSPGLSLGAKDAMHSGLVTAIKAPLSRGNSNRGMGFKSGENHDEDQKIGLDDLQGILGRLNGKPEAQHEMAQQLSQDIKTATPPKRGWQFPQFVSGGFLEGENPRKYPQEVTSELPSSSKKQSATTELDALQTAQTFMKEDPDKTEESTTIRHRKKRRQTGFSSNQAIIEGPVLKQILLTEKLVSTASLMNIEPLMLVIMGIAKANVHEAQQQLQKANRNRSRKLKESIEQSSNLKPLQECSASPISSILKDSAVVESLISSRRSSSLTQSTTGRHMVRQRYIKQKKMATMDIQALNEVSEIKGSFQ